MEEIKVYHSSLMNYLSLFFGIVIVGSSIWLYTTRPQEINFRTIFSAIVTLTALISTISLAYPMLRERLTGQPYCIITDRSLIVNTKNGMEIRFADVEEFYISKFDSKQILIRFKGDKNKPQSDGTLGRLSNRFGNYLANASEGINASGLTYEPQELCNLLNGKVEMA